MHLGFHGPSNGRQGSPRAEQDVHGGAFQLEILQTRQTKARDLPHLSYLPFFDRVSLTAEQGQEAIAPLAPQHSGSMLWQVHPDVNRQNALVDLFRPALAMQLLRQ